MSMLVSLLPEVIVSILTALLPWLFAGTTEAAVQTTEGIPGVDAPNGNAALKPDDLPAF